MTVTVKPSAAHGTVIAPPSKSVVHRALICAALSGGSKVTNVTLSDDINATVGGLTALNARVDTVATGVFAGGLRLSKISETQIDCNESGSTLRFLIPLAMCSGKRIVFTGKKRLFERDLSVYSQIAEEQGIDFIKGENSLAVCGKLKSGNFALRGDISSQFVSGLMFALPLLDGDSSITFTANAESRPYIDLTVKVLSDFGVIIKPQDNGYYIPGNQAYKSVEFAAEGDYSNAAFLDAFNLLGGNVKVNGLSEDTAQGDRVYKEYFRAIKSGGTFDLSDCPDLAPIMFALAAEFSGGIFQGTARLRIKESDRANAIKEELEKFGADICVCDNKVIIENKKLHAPVTPVCSHSDHRIVMSLCVLLSKYGGTLKGAEAVSKSFPEFFRCIKELGIEVTIK